MIERTPVVVIGGGQAGLSVSYYLKQKRIKHEFQTAFAEGLIVRGFERSETNPKYLLYKE